MAQRNDPANAAEQGLFTHLIELRARLLKAAATVLVAFVVLIPFANELYTQLALPLVTQLPAGAHLIATQVTSPFITPIKLALYVAFFIGTPMLVYQLWAFISPALYRHEKRLARPLLAGAIVLFYIGCAFAYFVVLPAAFRFLTGVIPQDVEMMTDINHYLNFVVLMFFAFGICFEVPVVVVLLAATRLIDLGKLRRWRRYALVLAFAVSAVVTPPDAISMFLLAIPMYALYELGLIAVRVLVRAPHDGHNDHTNK